MDRRPFRQVPMSPGALSSDAQMPGTPSTYFAAVTTPTAHPLPAHVPPIDTQANYEMPRAQSSASTATSSAASELSMLSVETGSTNITHPSSTSSFEHLSLRHVKKAQQSGSTPDRPDPFPLQASRFRRSDPGQEHGGLLVAESSRSAQGLGHGFVARRQTLPNETAAAFGKARPFSLSQPPRSHRNNPLRGSPGRVVWGREGLPSRVPDDSTDSPSAPNASPSYQGFPRPGPHSVRHLAPESQLTHRAPPNATPQGGFARPILPQSLVPPPGVGPHAFGNALTPIPQHRGSLPNVSPPAATLPNPLASSLARDALLTYAHKLYENPAPGARAPLGLSSRPLSSIEPESTPTNPLQTYNVELLPLLLSLRSLHPAHIPTALLLACVQYAVHDYEGSLRTNHEILEMDPNFVEAMSNIATTLRAMGNLHDAEQWWTRAIQLRPAYWDAIENITGVLCNPARPTDSNIPPGAHEPRFRQALSVCDFALQKIVPGPTILSGLSSGFVPVGQLYRLQNLLHTSGNLKFVMAATGESRSETERDFAGINDQFAAVELVLNRRSRGSLVPHLTSYDLLLGLAVSALHVTGNLPFISELITNAEDAPSLDLLFRIRQSQGEILKALTRNDVLPLVLIKPENIFSMMTWMFPSTKGLFPGIVDEAGNLNLDAIPAVLPIGSKNASRMTATVLLTLAKHFQDAATRGSLLPGAPTSGEGTPTIRASLSAALLLYYCALALCPSASVCNNLGILLSTLAGARVVCLTHPPGSTSGPPTSEVLTGPGLARAYYLQGLNLDPHHPHLLTNMASLLKEEGKIEEAIKMYARALEVKPDFDVALANIANANKDIGKIPEAIEYYKRAVVSNPYFPESIVGLVNALGSVCDWQGRGGRASDIYLDPTGAIVARPEGDNDPRALGFLDKLMQICDSQIVSGYHASAGVIASDRSFEEWMSTIESCTGPLNPKRRARWEKAMGRFYHNFDRAEKQVYEAGSVIRLIEMLSRLLQRRWYIDMYGTPDKRSKGKSRETDVSKYHRPRLPATMVAPLALSILPFHTFTLPLSTRRIRIISHRNAIRTSYLALSQDWLPRHVYQPPPPPDGGRIKIGYVSSDFNNHPLGHLMQSVFQFHNAKRFEIYCYATSTSDHSSYRLKIEQDAHHFVDVSSWSTQAIVERIASDEIHILINLNGYTKGARNDIFAVRPAPIIISLMGFAGTLASGWSDYILADLTACSPNSSALQLWRERQGDNQEASRLQDHFREPSLECDFDMDPDPEATSEHWMFSEKFILMPHTCFVTDHKQSSRADDRENEIALRGRNPTPDLIWKLEEIRRHKLRKSIFPDLADDWIIYANFNQLYKVDPVVFDAWLRILARTPRSILWLLRFPAVAEQNILRCAQQWAGAEIAARIRFTDVAPKEIHIQRCRVADLFLDTLECNAHTVATDVLWGGTPIVTWPRYEHKMCSRIAASIANATGYGRYMIVSSLSEYENRAVDLAKSVTFIATSDEHGGWYKQCRGSLSDLRRSLYLNRDTMPLFDTARWTRNVELAYEEVWRRWECGTEFEDSEEWLACSGEEKKSANILVREV